jgi:cytochrome c
MMKATVLVVAAVGLLGAGAGYAAESGADLAKAKGCLNCHAVDQKKVGPAFKDVAAKYKGNKEAATTLTAKLKDGKGHPKQAASESDIKKILEDYVLAQK